MLGFCLTAGHDTIVVPLTCFCVCVCACANLWKMQNDHGAVFLLFHSGKSLWAMTRHFSCSFIESKYRTHSIFGFTRQALWSSIFSPWKSLISTILGYRFYQTALFARRQVILGCIKVQLDKNEPPIEVLLFGA